MSVATADAEPFIDYLDGSSMTAEQVASLLDRFDGERFYPLISEGMPPPGPDFIAHACALGDPKPTFASKKADAKLVTHGPILEKLYRAALYDKYFELDIKVKGKLRSTSMLVGHRWGETFPVVGPIEQADCMVIGKWPGSEEMRTHRCFAGNSGILLRDVLLEVGMPEWEFYTWYITNLVRHENVDPSSNRLPSAWIRNTALLLEQELRLVRPKFVLCLGAEASSWLLGDEPGGTSASHGRILKKTIPIHFPGSEPKYHTFQYMTCIHPAAVCRTPARRPDLVGTVRRFVGLVKGEIIEDSELEKPDHRVVFTEAELSQIVDEVIAEHVISGQPSQAIAIDCEWHGEYWSSHQRPLKVLQGDRKVNEAKGEKESWLRTIQFSHKPGSATCIVLRHGGRRDKFGNDRVGTTAFVPGVEAVVRQLNRLFTETEDRKIRLVGHHLRADLPWLCMLDKQLGERLIRLYEPPEDDENPDGKTRLYGWQKARHFGGFDTLYGMHSIQETAERKLELVGVNLCGVRRYDGDVIKNREQICRDLKIKKGALQGYGEIDDENLFPYGCWDTDTTLRIFWEMVRPGGKLDKDQFGLPSWIPWWQSQGKLTAELEMEMTGLLVDHPRAEMLTSVYQRAHLELKKQLVELLNWPGFNPNSVYQVRTVLFGWQLAGKIDNNTGERVDPRPPEAMNSVLLGLTPIKSSGKPSQPWERIIKRRQEAEFTPSADKESLGVLLQQALAAGDEKGALILKTLRWYRFINRVITGVLCPPGDGDAVQFDEDGDMIFEKGVMACVEWDRRIRTHFLPVDTARVGSSKPNIQNFSKRREKDLQDILKSNYQCPLRSIITCEGDEVLVEADLTGAELAMMAIQSGSLKMVDHCQRANLPDGDPRQYDIHSTIAVKAFNLRANDFVPTNKDKNPNGLTGAQILGLPVGAVIPGLKSALWAVGSDHLRDVAKTIVFGIPYGRGDDAVVRAVEELGIKITTDHAQKIRAAIFGEYPELEFYFAACQARPKTPGWIADCFGGRRRFEETDSDEVLCEMSRQAGNFPIQGGVARLLMLILRSLRHNPDRYKSDGTPKYKLCAQIHDAAMCAVKIKHLRWFIEKALPTAFSTPKIYACNLDGERLPGRPGYSLGFDYGIYRHWGEKLSYDEGLELGIEPDFLPKKKK